MKHWLGMHWCFFALMSDVFDMLEVEQLWRFSQCMVTSTCGFMMTKACIMNFTTLVRCLCWQMQSSVLVRGPQRWFLVSKAKSCLLRWSSGGRYHQFHHRFSPGAFAATSQVALALRDAGGRQKLLKKPTPLTVRDSNPPTTAMHGKLQGSDKSTSTLRVCNSE